MVRRSYRVVYLSNLPHIEVVFKGSWSRLFLQKLSTSPPCGTVSADGMHDYLCLIPAFWWTDFASFDCRWYLSSSSNVRCYLFWTLFYFVPSQPDFGSVVMLWPIRRTWRPLFWFSDVLIGWNCSVIDSAGVSILHKIHIFLTWSFAYKY